MQSTYKIRNKIKWTVVYLKNYRFKCVRSEKFGTNERIPSRCQTAWAWLPRWYHPSFSSPKHQVRKKRSQDRLGWLLFDRAPFFWKLCWRFYRVDIARGLRKNSGGRDPGGDRPRSYSVSGWGRNSQSLLRPTVNLRRPQLLHLHKLLKRLWQPTSVSLENRSAAASRHPRPSLDRSSPYLSPKDIYLWKFNCKIFCHSSV